jgi:ribosomal protein S27AE
MKDNSEGKKCPICGGTVRYEVHHQRYRMEYSEEGDEVISEEPEEDWWEDEGCVRCGNLENEEEQE